MISHWILRQSVAVSKVFKCIVYAVFFQMVCHLALLRDTIITVNSMAILVKLLRINIENNTNSVVFITSFLIDILNGSRSFSQVVTVDHTMIDLFLDNHGIHTIAERLNQITRIETILPLYDLMITVFEEGTLKAFH